VVEDVPGDADREDVAEALVEDQLRGGARVDAAQHDRQRVLALAGLVDLLEQVAIRLEVVHEALVATPEHVDRHLRGERVTGLAGQGSHGVAWSRVRPRISTAMSRAGAPARKSRRIS